MVSQKSNLKKEYGKLYSEVEEILFRHDPISINFETNTDEYSPEVGTILPRLKTVKSQSDVYKILTEEFSKWFDISLVVIQNDPVYLKITEEIWDSWKRFKNDRPQ